MWPSWNARGYWKRISYLFPIFFPRHRRAKWLLRTQLALWIIEYIAAIISTAFAASYIAERHVLFILYHYICNWNTFGRILFPFRNVDNITVHTCPRSETVILARTVGSTLPCLWLLFASDSVKYLGHIARYLGRVTKVSRFSMAMYSLMLVMLVSCVSMLEAKSWSDWRLTYQYQLTNTLVTKNWLCCGFIMPSTRPANEIFIHFETKRSTQWGQIWTDDATYAMSTSETETMRTTERNRVGVTKALRKSGCAFKLPYYIQTGKRNSGT